MLDEEKERGRQIAHLSPLERSELVARMMFGDDRQHAQEALLRLMADWGVGPSAGTGVGSGWQQHGPDKGHMPGEVGHE